LSALHLSDDELKVYATVAARFEAHLVVRRNIVFERSQFNNRDQGKDESAEAYITTLYSMVHHLCFGKLHDELLRYRIVVGIKDKNLSEKLQMYPELTLKKAVDLFRQSEVVKRQNHP